MSSMVSLTWIDEMLLVSSFLLHRLFTYQRNIPESAKRVSRSEWASEQAVQGMNVNLTMKVLG